MAKDTAMTTNPESCPICGLMCELDVMTVWPRAYLSIDVLGGFYSIWSNKAALFEKMNERIGGGWNIGVTEISAWHSAAQRPEVQAMREAGKAQDKCGKFVHSFITRHGSYFSCVLPKEHEGDCKAGGDCFKHGAYTSESIWTGCPVCVKNNYADFAPPAPERGEPKGMMDADVRKAYYRGFNACREMAAEKMGSLITSYQMVGVQEAFCVAAEAIRNLKPTEGK